MSYQRSGENEHDDGPDVLAGIIEKYQELKKGIGHSKKWG